MSDAVQHHDIIVIGAGPAGLSLGYYLQKAGLDYVILEQGKIGQSWHSMPEKLVVLSPWWTNLLPGSWIGLTNPFSLVGKDFYHAYLNRYAVKNHINVRTNVTIKHLDKGEQHYHLDSDAGVFSANIVVCATGYFCNPRHPTLAAGNDGSIPEIHGADYYSAARLAEHYPQVKRILLVGKRVSAGQLMVELAHFGFAVDIACRSELTMRPSHTLKGRLKDFVYYFYEALKMRTQATLKRDSYVDMDDGETGRLLREGVVGKQSEFTGIANGMALFADGQATAYDLVLYATGYRPALKYVAPALLELGEHGIPATDNMESTRAKRLFFLGIDNLVNFRSRYLRGMADDAGRLARIIQEIGYRA